MKFYLRISQLSINIIVPSLHFASLNTLLSRRISHFPRITNILREIMEYAAYLSIGSRSFDQRDAHISSPGMSITATSFAPSASRPFMIDEPDPPTSTDYTTALTCSTRQIEISYKYRRIVRQKKRIPPLWKREYFRHAINISMIPEVEADADTRKWKWRLIN